jgi:lipid-A-disaccharide synthase
MTAAFSLLQREFPKLTGCMVLPNERLRQLAQSFTLPAGVNLQTGGLSQALAGADLALAKSGTITLECAAFGVPAVVLYKASTLTYLIARPLITVKYLAMPNLLADASVYPEFFQHEATPENLAGEARELLRNESRRQTVKVQLAAIMESLGSPGAAHRAAAAILRLLP